MLLYSTCTSWTLQIIFWCQKIKYDTTIARESCPVVGFVVEISDCATRVLTDELVR